MLDQQALRARGFLLLRRERAQCQAELTLLHLAAVAGGLRPVLRHAAQRRHDFLGGAVAPQVHRDLLARRGQRDQRRQIAGRHDGAAVDLAHHVAGLQAGLLGRAAFLDAGDQRAGRRIELERVGQVLVDLLHRHAQARMLHLAVFQDLVLDLVRHVDRDRERQALEAAGAAVDLRVDADHFAAVIEQRAAGIAGVHRHVGLDERHRRVVRQRAALGADDAGGGGVLQAVGRTDGQHPFAHLQLVDVADLHHRQVLGVDLDDGHVGLRIGAQHLGAEFAAVGQLDGHFLGALHHVGVGQDDAVAADDEARALAADRHFARRHAAARAGDLAEELGEGIVVVIGHLARAADADVDHGGAVVMGDLHEIGSAHGGARRRGARRRGGCGHGGRRAGRHRNAAERGGRASAANRAGGQQRQHQARGVHLRGLHVGSCVMCGDMALSSGLTLR
ncbi:Uncharacterised protein [Achromobacter sp. 2789STDY5608628]|nr:Uncharacterised protein [Achromobacter sp. 2789STDY5608628]